jgi:ribosomal protein L22
MTPPEEPTEQGEGEGADRQSEGSPIGQQAKPKAERTPAAQEAAAEKVAAKKPTAKKPTAKKPAAKQPAAKKPAAKKPPAASKPAAKEQEEAKAEKPAKAEPAKAEPAKVEPAKVEPAKGEEPVKTEQPAAAPRGASRAQGSTVRRKVVRAHARYVRTSARKARMVCGHLRGKSVEEARAILAFTPREVARDWSKLLESAVANAENNHELVEEDLLVREAYADEGPTIKRFRPRAQGRATPIRKRTSHLTITLTPKV